MNQYDKVKSILLDVEKPGRYIGNEVNIRRKNEYSLRYVISYPDLYEIGMSNYGIQILYNIINNIEDVSCERVFCPAPDMSSKLKDNEIPLYSLENYEPVKDADILSFNISHELLATNVLHILNVSQIPLKNCDRSENDPIVIAGGDAVSNPGPYSLYIDLISPGEGEEVVKEIAIITKKLKNEGKSRTEIINELSTIPGVLSTEKLLKITNSDNYIVYKDQKVSKRVFRSENLIDPEFPIVPSVRVTHERAVVQISRGCYNLCKFCHSGYYMLPCRFYNSDIVAEKANKALKNTGYDGINLLSLSISDYKDLTSVINKLLPDFNERGYSISLPSMKVDRATLPIINAISGVRKASLTFAVESANKEIRKRIHKRVDEDELIEIIKSVFQQGWKTIKLYFMLGLPGYKEYDEIEPAITLLKKINALGKNKNINCTFSPFVPKPHTPFQNEEMASKEYFYSCIDRLKKNLPRNISIKNHDIEMSIVEGILARGDESISDLIIDAYENGCYLDSWSEYFNKSKWYELLEKKYENYLRLLSSRSDENQPWSIINVGNDAVIVNRSKKILSDEELNSNRAKFNESLDLENIRKSRDVFNETRSKTETKYRVVYVKKDLSIFYSHLDMLEIFKRALRRADIPLSFSQGFNKREIIHSGFPLPLGISSELEYFDIEIYTKYTFDKEIINKLNTYLPDGFEIKKIFELENKNPKGDTIFEYVVSVDEEKQRIIKENYDQNISIKKIVKKKERFIELKNAVYNIVYENKKIRIMLYTGTQNSLRIDLILKTLFPKTPITEFEIVKNGHYYLENSELKEFITGT